MQEIIIKNPLSPKNIYNLLFHPSRLFAPNVFIRSKFWTLFVTFPFFITYILTSRLFSFNECFSPIATKLTVIMLVTLLSSAFTWYIQGWFYNLRVKWSGAIDHDKTEGKITMVYIIFIERIFIICLLLFSSKDSLILYLPIHDILNWYISILNYFAIKSKFGVQGIKPIVWFLITPMIPTILLIIYYIFKNTIFSYSVFTDSIFTSSTNVFIIYYIFKRIFFN